LIFAYIAIVFLLLAICKAASAELLNLHYAGFALGGQASDSKKAFPTTSTLLNQRNASGVSILDAELNRRLKGAVFRSISLDNSLGNVKTGDSLAIAFVLTWENVASEQLERDFKITVDLRAEALIFDFETMKVIAAYPFGVQVRDVSGNSPSPEKIRELISDVYFGGNHNILDRFVEILRTANIKRSYGAYAQVISVDLEDKATALMSTVNADPSQTKTFIADSFDALLWKNDSIPVLPFSKGQAIGGRMSGVFSNGDVFNLSLPEADYRIHLTARGFKKVEVDSDASEIGFAYASYFHVSIDQPLREKPYLDGDYKFAVSKVVPRAVAKTDDWAAYQESMLSLIDGLTKQFATIDTNWLGKWGDAGSRPQIELASSALAKCR
jgi:hypothetical protein